MDPFTQRMLERARARQEKIDQKLVNSGQAVPKRRPLTENIAVVKSEGSPAKSPSKISRECVTSPRRQSKESIKSETPSRTSSTASSKRSSFKSDVSSPQRGRNDVVVTKKEFKSPKRGSITRRNSDVSVEINISHRNDIQIEVQVEERDAPISVVYDSQAKQGSNVLIEEITDDVSSILEKAIVAQETRANRSGLRHNVKSRLDRLGNLYSDKPTLSSPVHRTELEFSSATPPSETEPKKPKPRVQQDGKKKFGRLAALADQINNWEDDLTHHTQQPDNNKKAKTLPKTNELDKLDASTLEVSINSFKDINKVLDTTVKATQPKRQFNSHTFTKPSNSVNECQRLGKQIVAELEGEGYRRVSASQSRLVYEFTTKTADPDRQEPKCATTPSADSAPNMATMVAPSPANTAVTKKPSIKKYKAPTPPRNVITEDECESEKDKENAVQLDNENDASDDCKQTKPEPVDDKPAPEKGSPLVKKLGPKINGSVDRSSVLSKAAMFEAGSPKAKDPAEMTLRERKALFEKNKGAAIVPKAPFGLAPSAKSLLGDNKADKRPLTQKTTPTKNSSLASSRTNSKDDIPDDNISQTSLGGGIKGKLAALFSKEQTISESTIANKFKQEREKEMEMLQNRFHYKPKPQKAESPNDSDDDVSEHDPSEKAPLMGSTTSLNQNNKKPEIISNIPKVTFDEKSKIEQELNDKEKEIEKENDRVIGSQPVKRRSSQDSPVVLSVLDDVKRIKVNNSKKEPQTNGAVLQQPASLYPHLSDIETDTSHTQEEFSDCGGSSSEDYIPPCVLERMNKSDNWAETSFGREVMNVVKKNNTSYKKAVRESDSDSSGLDSELDDILDEAINEQSEGPTPPKINKERSTFKSPLKLQSATPSRADHGNELVHSVSFYRRMQNASSAPSTPMRIIRHTSPEREPPATPDEPAASVTTVRERIKELQAEITKQQTVISQVCVQQSAAPSTPMRIIRHTSPEREPPATPDEPAASVTTVRERIKELQAEITKQQTVISQVCVQQSAAPSTPMRIIRHTSPEREPPATPDEPAASVTTVRERIKELQAEITKQQTVISQASQALNLCAATIEFSGSTEQAEGERLLLLASHRRQACLHELQRLQVEGAGPAATAGMATLHLTQLSVPLKRDYVRQLNADGAVGHHAVCLVKCRDRVLATSMQQTQPSTTLLHFPDDIRMLGLASDFKVTVEVYLLQASKEVLSHEMKYHISSKKSSSKLLTPKSKISELKAPRVQSPAGPLAVRSPQFALHGYCIFALQQASRRSFTLNKVPCGSPLEGSVNLEIKARVQVPPPSPHAAFLTAFDDVSGLGAWHRRWFRLQPPRLAYWKYPDDVHRKMPIGDIDLSTVVSERVIKAPRDLCARPNTILLESSIPAGLIVPESGSLVYVHRPDGSVVRRHLLAADTPKDRDIWLDCLNKALEYVRCCGGDED
ncbi:anillin isoform X2 [Helicoverpa armigera]|uniref:anillin isoform X2 n=1 Tax=Helicoverpa armigera TaxID=29058 RepID=UPI003082B8C3